MMQSNVRVLVVDDSAFMRKIIKDILELDDRITVVDTARNGEDALKKLNVLERVDVITLDVEMPIMNGLETLKEIMKKRPTPSIMISSTTTDGAENTIKAFEYGAVDFVAKTSGAISLDLHKVKDEIIEKVLLAAKVKIKNVLPLSNSYPKYQSLPKNKVVQSVYTTTEKKIIAIGTSTGGPKALQEVLIRLPRHLPAPIIIVQHMPAGFTKSLSERLNTLAEIEVKEAVDGEVLRNGVAYIAPGNYHLLIRKLSSSLVTQLVQTPPIRGHRPSVDVMFESLADIKGIDKIAVIMTGMGSDGTKGLQALKNSTNCFAIAESEESSVVFGMPRAAITSNNVDDVVHLKDIAATIMKQFK